MAFATLPDLIAHWSEIDPAAPAILAPGRATLTRAGLREQIRRTASSLLARGHAPGTRIAIAMPDGPECAVALLGVSAVATAVPLNPAADEESLRTTLTSVAARALVVPEHDGSRASTVARGLGLDLIAVRGRPREPAGTFELGDDQAETSGRYPTPRPDEHALVMHSSGTTGKPKLVVSAHEALVKRSASRARFLRLGPNDRCLSVTPLHTPAGIRRNLLAPLVAGGSVVCTSGFDPAAFLDWLEETGATFFPASATVHHAVAQLVREKTRPARHSLRLIVSGAVGLLPEARSRLEAAFGIPVIQGYAMLEADVVAHEALGPSDRRPGSVGQPVDREIAILGDDGVLQGPLEAGEILIRGPELFREYEGDAEATRLAFHGDWYRTGDLGYLDSDGYLYVTGRLKELINRGGDKVSPALVDRIAARHPAIDDVATFGVPHPTLGEDVNVAVVVRDGAAIDVAELRTFLLAHLEPKMVPSRIVFVDGIPRNAAGKVQRSKLAASQHARRSAALTLLDDEREIAELFAQVLGIDYVDANDDFFALGGDSLRAVQLANRASEIVRRTVSPLAVFENPTVTAFAALLRSARASTNEGNATSGVAGPSNGLGKGDRRANEVER